MRTRTTVAALRLTCVPACVAQVLRKQCLTYPSRADTLAAITAMKQDIAALEQESAATAATVEVRATAAALAHAFATRYDAPRSRRSRRCSCASSSSPRCSAASTTSAVRCKKMAPRLPPPPPSPPPRPRPCSWTSGVRACVALRRRRRMDRRPVNRPLCSSLPSCRCVPAWGGRMDARECCVHAKTVSSRSTAAKRSGGRWPTGAAVTRPARARARARRSPDRRSLHRGPSSSHRCGCPAQPHSQPSCAPRGQAGARRREVAAQ